MKTYSVYTTLSMLLLFCSCSKTSHYCPNDDVTVTAQNVAGTYALVGLSTNFNDSVEQDLFHNMESCAQDNTYSLRPNGTFTYNDVGTMCANGNSSSGTWQLVDKLTVRLGAATHRISHFTGKRLVLTTDTTINGRTGKLIKKFLRS